MALPVEIEGQSYWADLPRLGDFVNIRDFMRNEIRRTKYAAIPPDLPDDQFDRWVKRIDAECDAVDPFRAFLKVFETPAGMKIGYHAMLRHSNTPPVSLEFVAELIDRAAKDDKKALLGIRALRETLVSLIESKKNEFEQVAKVAAEALATSTQSTSDLPDAGGSPRQ